MRMHLRASSCKTPHDPGCYSGLAAEGKSASGTTRLHAESVESRGKLLQVRNSSASLSRLDNLGKKPLPSLLEGVIRWSSGAS